MLWHPGGRNLFLWEGARIRVKEDFGEVVHFKMGFEGCRSVLGIDA